MNRLFSSRSKTFAAACVLALGVFSLSSGGVQAQLVKPKPRISNDLVVQKHDLKIERFTGTWPRPGKQMLLGGQVKNISKLPYDGGRVAFLYTIRADKKLALLDTVILPKLQPGQTFEVRFKPIDPRSVETFNFKMELSGSDGDTRNNSATTHVSEV